MKRRDFTKGLIAAGSTGAALPALASNDPTVPTRLKISIIVAPGSRAVQIRTILFFASAAHGVSYNVNREFNYRNEDRKVIKGLTPPRLVDQVAGADRIGQIRISDQTLIVDHQIDQAANNHLLLGDEGTTYEVGKLSQLRKKQISKVPLLGDLPVVGSLFRSKNNADGKRNLLIFISPSIIKET